MFACFNFHRGGYVIYQQGKQLNDNTLALADAKEVNAKNERLITEQRKLLENQGGLLDSLKKIKPKVIVDRKSVV